MIDTRPFTQYVSGGVIISGSSGLFFSFLLFDTLGFRAGLKMDVLPYKLHSILKHAHDMLPNL